jgi:hypothetical protein
MVQQAQVRHPETVDYSICDRLRLLRLPNTRDRESGLYKVPLRVEELMDAEPEEIRRIARHPRPPWLTNESGMLPRHEVKPAPGGASIRRWLTASRGTRRSA